MPSPFPGMDPYLEAPGNWWGFHHTFIVYARELLTQTLPAHYSARIAERRHYLELGEEREIFLQILLRESRSVVTRIELLTEENKTLPGHERYLATRNECLLSELNLVELDL